MNGKEYVQACKQKLKLNSYYKLALALEINETELNFYKRGERQPSVYACFKFAECLGLDPAAVIADIASETEKNPNKRNYFKSFIAGLKVAAASLLIVTALWNSTNEETAYAV